MRLNQSIYKSNNSYSIFESDNFDKSKAQLVLGFSERTVFEETQLYSKLEIDYPNAQIVLCSTSGQISNNGIVDKKIVTTAIEFEKAIVKAYEVDIKEEKESSKCGELLVNKLFSYRNDLKAMFILSEGTFVNATELINTIKDKTNGNIPIFGGLAGDEDMFEKTLVGLNQEPQEGKIVAIGFYGENFEFGFGSDGGWNDFGEEIVVTKSDKNILYEINGIPALDLYKEFLGIYAKDLPGSSLFFPLSMRMPEENTSVVRTILSINENEKSMTFAANIPHGALVKMMNANLDNLINASEKASSETLEQLKNPELAILISCVGRKLVLSSRVDEELHAARAAFGNKTILTGFYSYAELSPSIGLSTCDLHNQTMTITTFKEILD